MASNTLSRAYSDPCGFKEYIMLDNRQVEESWEFHSDGCVDNYECDGIHGKYVICEKQCTKPATEGHLQYVSGAHKMVDKDICASKL